MSDQDKVGHVQLQVQNNRQPHQNALLQIRHVLYKPSAPDNLLSLTTRGLHVLLMQQRDQMDETSLTRWHLRFTQLNIPALQQMARQQVATGMSGELTDDFGGPCWSYQSQR